MKKFIIEIVSTGGLIILHNSFEFSNLVLSDNVAYFGGAIFFSANFSAKSQISNVTFINNNASLGKHVLSCTYLCMLYWTCS
jgi:hypothetical protein